MRDTRPSTEQELTSSGNPPAAAHIHPPPRTSPLKLPPPESFLTSRMSPAAPSDTPIPDPGPTSAHRDARYLAVLDTLLEVSASIARRLQQQADAPDPPTQANSALVEDFERLSRAVRRNMLLARHIQSPAAADPAPAPHTHARKQIIRGVEDAIHHKVPGEHAETLHAELLERLDAPDFDEDIGHRPIPDIITDICRDLGLNNASGLNLYKRRTPADIALLSQRAARNSTPARAHLSSPHHRPAAPLASRASQPRQQSTGSDPPQPAGNNGIALLERALRVSTA